MKWLERFMNWLILPLENAKDDIPCPHAEWQAEGEPVIKKLTSNGYVTHIPDCTCNETDTAIDCVYDRLDQVSQWMFIYIIISFSVIVVQFILLLFTRLNLFNF